MRRARRVRLDLRPQPLDVHVEGLGVADVVRAPHPVDELPRVSTRPALRSSSSSSSNSLSGSATVRAGNGHDVALHVHPDRAGLEHAGQPIRLGGLAAAAQHGPDPGDQLAGE